MKKSTTKKERLCVLSAFLTAHPNEKYPLAYFSDRLGAARSTLSEDISTLKDTLRAEDMGDIEIILGSGGGFRYIPALSQEKRTAMAEELAARLRDPSRILPGGYIYTADVLLDPKCVAMFGNIIWSFFQKATPDAVITVETKGIPVASEVARLFGKPLVVVRKENKMTEGSVVTTNYISTGSGRMQTLSLSKRAVREGQRVIIVDDFIAGGGTVRAIAELMREFRITVLGCGAAISKKEPEKKRLEGYKSVLSLDGVDEENNRIDISIKSELNKSIC